MRQLIIVVWLLMAVGLQSGLRSVWQPLGYVDLTLILVVYFALQRQPLQALIVGAASGLLTDFLVGRPALLGAGGFSKTLTAYAVYFVASRVMLDTAILRIPVLASASLIDNVVYVAMHRLLGQSSPMPFIQSLSYKLIATTAAGTILLYGYESFFSSKARQRRQFTIRRRVVRGNTGSLRRRSR